MRILLVLMVILLGACDRTQDADEHSHADESWAVTAWGDTYEIFAECDPLVAGHSASSYTHVTVLGDFSPLRSGTVSVVLRSAGGEELVFAQDKPTRDGIFTVAFEAAAPGDYDLVYRVHSGAGTEDVASGRVRVGTAGAPGGLVAHPPTPGHHHTGASAHEHAADVVSFLKEQQWRTAFLTQWTTQGKMSASVRAPATVRAAAGAEIVLTAPLDGVVSGDTRVFVGRAVKKGDVLVSLAPRAASDMTLSELEAETQVARSRVERMEELLKLGAVSLAEVEAARARLAALEPALAAAQGSTAGTLAIRAPFDGRVAETSVTLGASVDAGDPLVRLVRTPPFWIEAAVAPRDVARLRDAPARVSLEAPGGETFLAEGGSLRLVSVSPEIDRATGTVTVILEITEPIPYPLGSLVTADLLLAQTTAGIVVPASAIIDDSGTPVVYLQADGESFERRAVEVVTRQGAVVLVNGLHAGERLVVIGSNAIRRAALLSSGEVEGHVH